MVRDAESHAEEDKKRRGLVDARVEAERQIHAAEKSLEELGDKVADADKSALDAAVADLKSVLDSEDTEAITAKTTALAQASMKLGEAMYRAAAEASEAAEGDSASAEAEDVVDADFEEVDDGDQKKSA